MRTVALDRPCGGRCGGQKPGMAAHHYRDVNARQRAIVKVGSHERLGHESRRRGKAWGVVVFHQIVVDGLGNVDGAQVVALLRRLLADDAHGIGRIVAADIQEPGRAVGLQRCEDVPAIGQIGLVSRRAQGRGRRGGDRFEIGPAFGRKVDEILVHDAAHPVACAIDPLDLRKQSRFEHGTGQRLIDHRRRAAAHGDHQLAASHSLWLPVGHSSEAA